MHKTNVDILIEAIMKEISYEKADDVIVALGICLCSLSRDLGITKRTMLKELNFLYEDVKESDFSMFSVVKNHDRIDHEK